VDRSKCTLYSLWFVSISNARQIRIVHLLAPLDTSYASSRRSSIVQRFRGHEAPSTPTGCLPWVLVWNIGPYIFLGATQALLNPCMFMQQRHTPVHALYECSKRLLLVLCALYITSFMCSMVAFPIALHNLTSVTLNSCCDVLSMPGHWAYLATMCVTALFRSENWGLFRFRPSKTTTLTTRLDNARAHYLSRCMSVTTSKCFTDSVHCSSGRHLGFLPRLGCVTAFAEKCPGVHDRLQSS
jgi:hypothetical protein